jgi:bifunctional UDP-N-acetylglucosamine pyrophosphorylase / glucosamine-1-phosphate N-acetyltransferase
LPKVLVPVAGRSMLEWLVALYAPFVERFVIIAAPATRTAITAHVAQLGVPSTVLVQERPTGMLDAIVIARAVVEASAVQQIWITWCDQVGVHPRTVERLADLADVNPSAAIVMPTCSREEPYIHLQRGSDGRIADVLHRREGDPMPAIGESDMGLFSLSRRAFVDDLHAYATAATLGTGTGERNFLPFIPWAEARGGVLTFPCVDEEESIGVNTPEELALIENYLQSRGRK